MITERGFQRSRTIGAYGGEFAEGRGYVWAEGIRQEIHRRALDAHLRLAQLEEADGHDREAMDILVRAVEIGGCAEEPCRRLMILQARLGRTDAVASTWLNLQRRLAELELDPEPATVTLYRRMAGQ